ncbi:MAG: hypothetical protein KTR14_04355 [Vampirovibrio sp.]|nr:hypothetical protein [Vampirovibrio sp.]
MKKSPVTLLQEIQEQPGLLQALVDNSNALFSTLQYPKKNVTHLVAIAEGSSKNALEIAAPFIETWTGLPLSVYDPESLEERFAVTDLIKVPSQPTSPAFLQNAHYIVVSQSGETASVLSVLDTIEARISISAQTQVGLSKTLSMVAITNNSDSTLAKRYGNILALGTGVERSIAATKTMTASLMLLLLWGLHAGHASSRISTEAFEAIRQTLAQAPQCLGSLWEETARKQTIRFTRKLMEVNHFVLLSKGPLVKILPEAGLKLTETSSNIVYTDNAESFKHGPKVMLSGVNGAHPNTLYIVPRHKETAAGLFKDLRAHFWINPFQENEALAFENDRVFFIRFENSPPVPDSVYEGLSLKKENILLLPPSGGVFDSLFLALVAFQLISYELAILKGEDPNNPALEKAVTD